MRAGAAPPVLGLHGADGEHVALDAAGLRILEGTHTQQVGQEHPDDLAGSSTVMRWPWLSTTPRSQIARMVSAAWVTSRMVRPSRWNCLTRSMHLRWKRSSPTARTSSITSTSGSTFTATAKPSRTYMPEE